MRTWLAAHRAAIFHWGMEVVIVVIGILIAFALQDWAADRASRRRAADAERRIRAELVENSHDFVERIAIQPCLRQRVVDLSRAIAAADVGWRPSTTKDGARLTVLPEVYPSPSRSSSSDAYRGALTDGDLATTDTKLRSTLAFLYVASDRLDALNKEENTLADSLQPLQLTGVTDSSDRRVALTALARLDSINGLASLIARQYFLKLSQTGYQTSAGDLQREWGRSWSELAAYGRDRYGKCWDTGALAELTTPR